MGALYASVAEVKLRLGIEDGKDDLALEAALKAAADLIDGYCGRTFATVVETRYFDGNGRDRMALPDLVAATDVRLDTGEDGTFATALLTSDYLLYPYSRLPKTELQLDPRRGRYTRFPAVQRYVSIAGTWGYWSTVPDGVRQAAMMTAARLHKRAQSGYATVVGGPQLAQMEVHQGLDPDVKLLLNAYRRARTFV